jgi:arabinofuranosyltransferase
MKFPLKIILPLLIMGVVLQLYYFDFMLDDPYISFRYAYNFINGHGLVFNEGERVEGYTNFLWIILIATFIKARFDPIFISKLLGVIFSAATSIIVFFNYTSLRKEVKDTLLPILSVTLITTNWFFNIWSIGGLETPLYTFLLVIAIYQFNREITNNVFPISGGLYALLCMTRPDGMIFAVVAGLFKLYILLKRKKFLLRDFIWYGELIFTYGFYFMWRWNYYGMFLPNTFYAKTGGGYAKYQRGLDYVFSFFPSNGYLYFILFLLGVLWFIYSNRKNVFGVFLIINIFVQLLFIVFAGGDWMPGFRFFVPIIPIVVIIVVDGLYSLIGFLINLFYVKMSSKSILITSVAVVAIVITQLFYQNQNLQKNLPWLTSWFGKLNLQPHGPYYGVASFLNQNARNGSTLALGEAGIIPYYCENLKIIDFLGLIDVHISHLEGLLHYKSDANYVLKHNPDWVLLIVAVDKNGIIRYAGPPIQQFLDNKYFNENYELVQRIQRGTLGELDDYFYIYKKIHEYDWQDNYDFYDHFEDAVIVPSKAIPSNPWHSNTAKDLFIIKDVKRWGIFAIPDSRISYVIHIPDKNPLLFFGIGLFEKSWEWEGDGLRFQISVSENNTNYGIYDRYLDPTHILGERRWCDTMIDMSRFSGHNVTISFITKNDSGKTETADWAIWSDPILGHKNPLSAFKKKQ